VRACERDGLLSEALALYSAMVDRVRVSGHEAPPPDVVTYNSLIKVCCRATDPCAGFFAVQRDGGQGARQ
jgi:hypothetical protein